MFVLMLGAFSCVTLGCGSPGPPVIPEDAKEQPKEEMTQSGNTASETLTE
jgi:predicted small lipoprotein YifL